MRLNEYDPLPARWKPTELLSGSLAAAALALTVGVGPASAQAPGAAQPKSGPIDAGVWQPAIEHYVHDPVAAKDEIIALARQGTDGLPPMGLVIVGDAYMRSGNGTTARRYFALVADGEADARESTLAHLGLGMISLRTGDLQDARANFELATQVPAESPDASVQFAELGVAGTAAAMGDHDQALEEFDALIAKPDAPPGVRRSARLVRASTLMAAGRYDEAAAAFDEIASAEGDAGRDARFAAARARLAAGESDQALENLRQLVKDCPDDAASGDKASPRRPARGVRDLEPYGVLRTWVDNYNDLAFDEGVYSDNAPLYSIRGCELARTTLAALDAGEVLPQPGSNGVKVDQAEGGAPGSQTAPSAATAPAKAPAGGASEGRSSRSLIVILIAGVAVILAALAWFRRRG